MCTAIYINIYRLRAGITSHPISQIQDGLFGMCARLYACMYARMCIFVFVCMHACMHVCMRVWGGGWSHICRTYVQVCLYIVRICMHVYMCACACVRSILYARVRGCVRLLSWVCVFMGLYGHVVGVYVHVSRNLFGCKCVCGYVHTCVCVCVDERVRR